MKRLLSAAFLLLLSALVLAACGSSESDEDKIVSVIETATTSTDPASCEETQTTAFIEQNNSKGGKEAVKECEEEAEEGKGNPESVDVSEVEVEGSEAGAVVAITGGTLDGQTIELGLIEEEGDWKVNEFAGFKVFDREKLIASFEESFEESEAEPELAECLLEVLEESEDSEIEEVVIAGDEGVNELIEECAE